MTNQTAERNPAAENARAKLRDLARCTAIRLGQYDDGEVCLNDMLPLNWNRGHWEHDPATISRLRNSTYDGRWPE